LPPAAVTPPLTGMMYTANAGALFQRGEKWEFLVSRMAVTHRQAEHQYIEAFWRAAGVVVVRASQTWEGQADVATLPANRFLLSWGVRSVKPSLDQVRARLPEGAQVLDVQLREPWFHGDTCMDALTNHAGETVLLVYPGALVDRTLADLRRFVGEQVEVLAVDEPDCLGYACNSLCVGGTVLLPSGLSPRLRDELIRRGFPIEELELPELFGKGGGGPRCLVNELGGFVLPDVVTEYAAERPLLMQLAESYPESIQQEGA
jgi:N-dimethylarginine dimethylaminohydrolase